MSDRARNACEASGAAAAAGGVSVQQVSDLMAALVKTLRAHQLYDTNNPVYQRFVGALRSAFTDLWSQTSELALCISEDAITWNGTEVYRSDNRSDSLAFLFYKDGVRGLTLSPGFEEDDLHGFLEVLHRAKHLRTEEDDLLTLLWEREFANLRYTYVDLFTEGAELPGARGLEAAGLRKVMEGELAQGAAGEAEEVALGEGAPAAPVAASITREDFDATLYFLDGRELRYLREEVEREVRRDVRADVLAALFDRLEEPNRVRQSEVLGVLGTLLPNLLSRGALDAVVMTLRELEGLVRRGDVLDEERTWQVEALFDELSSPSAIAELVRAVEVGAVAATPEALGELFQYLRVGALGPLIRAAEEVRQRELRALLGQAVERIAQRYPDALVEHLRADDALIAAGAVRLVGRLGLVVAAGEVARLLAHSEPQVRLAAVEALVALRSPRAAEALERALADPEREVRIAAARGVGALRYPPARAWLREIIDGKAIRGADLTEKIAFFEAFGSLGNGESVGVLDRLLNGRGFLGRREPSEMRACAALALGRIRTPEAVKALQAAAADEDPMVRSAVSRALRGEG